MKISVTHPQTEIRFLVRSPAPVLDIETSIEDAATALRLMNSSAALVGGPSSIVTERDLTKAWSAGLEGCEPVKIIASHHPIAVAGDTPIVEAAALMLNQEVRHLVVVDGSDIGIVSLRTVMAVLLQAAQPELWLAALRLQIG